MSPTKNLPSSALQDRTNLPPKSLKRKLEEEEIPSPKKARQSTDTPEALATPEKKISARKKAATDPPSYRRLDKPHEAKMGQFRAVGATEGGIQKGQTFSWTDDVFRVSTTDQLPKSNIRSNGKVKDFNLTALKAQNVKVLVNKLKAVVPRDAHSVRGDKAMIMQSMMLANAYDDSDEDLIEAVFDEMDAKRKKAKGAKKSKKVDSMSPNKPSVYKDATPNEGFDEANAGLNAWKPKWLNEPLYEMLIIRELFEDPDVVIIRLATTRGDLVIRTAESDPDFQKFEEWLMVKWSHMHGFQLKRRNYGGMEIEEKLVSDYPGYCWHQPLHQQIQDVNTMMEERGGSAAWVVRAEKGIAIKV